MPATETNDDNEQHRERGAAMNDFPIPVRMVGAGSQVEEDELQYLAMPRDMMTFVMPRVPEKVDPEAMRIARDRLAGFLAALDGWDPAGGAPGPQLDLAGTAAPVLAIVNQVLGEGEVSVRIGGGADVRIQESVFTGIWRVCEPAADGTLRRDWIEAASIPAVTVDAAQGASAPMLTPVDLPSGAMNSPALLREIGARLHDAAPGAAPHVVNLTLFPMSPDDHSVLVAALGVGPVAMISRGFGNCHITSTRARNVWRVQYFNSMKTLILDTIEVVHVPEEALAAPEDLADSRMRLAELVDWMSESCPDG
jgi:hydrogenase-1 operon protein HyaF